MDIHKPKAWAGWREFAKEIGTIVIGVLIALAGEQFVETLKVRHELEEARRAIREEVSWDLGVYDSRLQRSGCVEQRLSELTRWWESWRDGRPLTLAGPIGAPTDWTPQLTIWNTALGGVAAQMPFAERTGYATIYDRLRNFASLRQADNEAWTELAQFDEARTLDPASLMRLKGLIARIRDDDQRFKYNKPYVFPLAIRLGVRPSPPIVPISDGDRQFCRPILP